tara:strand:+ start:628 stop:1134 length:507 start_codon:yes stop_codon:yes gene_type:complete
MNQYYPKVFLLSLFLIFLQVLIFDRINLFGFMNPSIYIIVLIIHRYDLDQFNYIVVGFLLGFIMDILSQSAGSHSLSCVTISFLRPLINKFSLGPNYEDFSSPFSDGILISNKVLYCFLITIIHQIILNAYSYFNWTHTFIILKLTIANSIFTFIVIVSVLNLFSTKE